MILRAAKGLRDSHRLRLKNKPEHKQEKKKRAGLRKYCSNQSKEGKREISQGNRESPRETPRITSSHVLPF